MKAGKLDRRVTILGMGPATDDGLRVKAGGWFKLYDRWAELTPLTGAERVAAAENAAFETLKFRVRRDQKTILIGPKTNRLIYRGEPFDIQAVQEVGREALDLLVTGRADAADEAEAE